MILAENVLHGDLLLPILISEPFKIADGVSTISVETGGEGKDGLSEVCVDSNCDGRKERPSLRIGKIGVLETPLDSVGIL